MKLRWLDPIRIVCIALLGTYAFAGVTVNYPANGATVGSPVSYSASSTSSCSKGVASMGVYVDNQLVEVQNGNSFNGSVNINSGSHHTVVEEWDYCGGASYTPIDLTVSSQSGVWVTTPKAGNVNTPVNYTATATSTCSKGVASMGVYVDNQLTFVSPGASLNTNVSMSAGKHDTVVEEWDYCGGAAYTHVAVTASGGGGGNVFNNLQASGGWKGYGEYPPDYDVCESCGPGVTWSMTQGVQSPSLTGNATKFTIGGNHPYSDVLWTNPLIGTNSSQGLPDKNHTLIPTLHNFTYDIYFYTSSISLAQVLEFDINQYFDGMGFTWGHQCNLGNGHQFDIWDNVNAHWIHTGVPCNPNNNAWNHLTLQVSRTSDNKLQYHAITLNGVTKVLDWYYPPFSVGNWYGITANYQMDGNSQQSSYSVYVDQFSFTYQ